jgi:hypothetical protein
MYLVSRLRHSKAIVIALLALYFFVPRVAQAAGRKNQPFRFGNAAAPFGWSTAVADLDSDQKLDFAVADRTGNGANGYNYRLQLSLSQAESQVFHFRSPDSALNVSIVDLDNDADLDIVLTHALSGEIAGVWLNNGEGGFRQGNAADFASELKIARWLSMVPAKAARALATLPLRKNGSFQASAVRFTRPVRPAPGKVRNFEPARSAAGPYRFIALRAPPSSILS